SDELAEPAAGLLQDTRARRRWRVGSQPPVAAAVGQALPQGRARQRLDAGEERRPPQRPAREPGRERAVTPLARQLGVELGLEVALTDPSARQLLAIARLRQVRLGAEPLRGALDRLAEREVLEG